jgi:tetratricopeptide (TPR) repeat protein
MKRQIILLTLFILSLNSVHAQSSDVDKARAKYDKAIYQMDNGNPDEAIALLKDAKKLDPANAYEYDYETGYAYFIKKDYPTAIKMFEKVVKYPEVTSRAYQMLGNIYDISGNSKKAVSTYDEGLKKFPKAGNLYLEKGMLFMIQKDYNNAIANFEKGIEVDPAYSTNYYRAAQIYLGSKDKVWGMIYGEIFLNLERNSKRTVEISKLMYKTYFNNITITSDTSAKVTFASNTISIDINNFKVEDFKLPYGLMVYEPTLLIAIKLDSTKTIDYNSLNPIRTRFADIYASKDAEKYPNVLFEYQKKILDAGHMEAYNYWVLTRGNSEAFSDWEMENTEKSDKFIEWFANNPLKLSDTYRISRSMLE